LEVAAVLGYAGRAKGNGAGEAARLKGQGSPDAWAQGGAGVRGCGRREAQRARRLGSGSGRRSGMTPGPHLAAAQERREATRAAVGRWANWATESWAARKRLTSWATGKNKTGPRG
jgi:hypothetical protein